MLTSSLSSSEIAVVKGVDVVVNVSLVTVAVAVTNIDVVVAVVVV